MISNQKDPNTVSAEITNLVFKTIDISQLSDLDALNRIRKLNLDIMIDVMGYTSRNRIGCSKIELHKNK